MVKQTNQWFGFCLFVLLAFSLINILHFGFGFLSCIVILKVLCQRAISVTAWVFSFTQWFLIWSLSFSTLRPWGHTTSSPPPPLAPAHIVVRMLQSPHVEKTMLLHSSTLAWKIPWTEEPGRLQTMGLKRVGHDWATSLSLFTFMHWRRKWQPTPVFLPGESQGQRSCRLWGHTESDTTKAT